MADLDLVEGGGFLLLALPASVILLLLPLIRGAGQPQAPPLNPPLRFHYTTDVQYNLSRDQMYERGGLIRTPVL